MRHWMWVSSAKSVRAARLGLCQLEAWGALNTQNAGLSTQSCAVRELREARLQTLHWNCHWPAKAAAEEAAQLGHKHTESETLHQTEGHHSGGRSTKPTSSRKAEKILKVQSAVLTENTSPPRRMERSAQISRAFQEYRHTNHLLFLKHPGRRRNVSLARCLLEKVKFIKLAQHLRNKEKLNTRSPRTRFRLWFTKWSSCMKDSTFSLFELFGWTLLRSGVNLKGFRVFLGGGVNRVFKFKLFYEISM